MYCMQKKIQIKYLNEIHWTVFVCDRSRFMKLQSKCQQSNSHVTRAPNFDFGLMTSSHSYKPTSSFKST
jgi:hypothetical protein